MNLFCVVGLQVALLRSAPICCMCPMWAGGATGRGAEAQIPQRPGPLHGEVMGFLFPSCKFVWREVAKARMRPHRVVVLPPALDDDLRFGARAERIQL